MIFKKTVNTKVKLLLQPSSDIWKINIKCFQGYRLAKKENKDFKKNKSTDTLFIEVFSRK